MFRAAAMGGGPITVRPITDIIFGGADRTGLRPATLPAHKLVAPSSLRRGDPSNVLDFVPGAEMRARLGVFAAKQDGVERAALLLVPPSGAPDRVLVGITYVFAQSAHNLEVFNGLGWSNPLSPPLIKWAANVFIGDHWGRQMMASGKSMAMLLPIRARGHGELGPFAHAAFLKKVASPHRGADGGLRAAAGRDVFIQQWHIRPQRAITRHARKSRRGLQY